jgi:hypothetical protein
MRRHQPLRAAFGVTHTDSLQLLQLEQAAWQALPPSAAAMHAAGGPTRPAREIAITARRTAAADPANYDQGPDPTPGEPPRRPGTTTALAAAAVTALTILGLSRPALAAGLAILVASVTARLALRNRNRRRQYTDQPTEPGHSR